MPSRVPLTETEAMPESVFRGLFWGALFSVPLWVAVFYVVWLLVR